MRLPLGGNHPGRHPGVLQLVGKPLRLGLGLGPVLIGALSEHFRDRFEAEALRYAAVSVCGFYIIAALLMIFAAKRLRAGWVEEWNKIYGHRQ